MAKENDYGIYKINSDGTLSWVVTEIPFVLSEPGVTKGIIDNLSCADAITVAEYLSNTHNLSLAPGRPHLTPH